MKTLRAFALLAVLAGLSACGFQLRGSGDQYNMPFKSIYLAFADTSSLGTELRRNLRGGDKVEVVTDPVGAEARFEVLAENRGKSILSLNSQGRVREYTLLYRMNFRVVDKEGRQLLAPTDLVIRRIQSFNENQVLAKEAEEATLFREMQSDLVQQVLRRVAAIKPVQ